MSTFTKEDKKDIVEAYLYGNMSIRQIKNWYYPDHSFNSIRNVLLNTPATRMKLNQRTRNRKKIDDYEVFYMYKTLKSLRATARELNLGVTTVRTHIYKYQQTHDVKPLLKEKSETNDR